MNVFEQMELKVGLELLKIIGKPYEEFKSKYKEILALISELEETKRIVVRQAHQPGLILYLI